jgi:hypothetical protein
MGSSDSLVNEFFLVAREKFATVIKTATLRLLDGSPEAIGKSWVSVHLLNLAKSFQKVRSQDKEARQRRLCLLPHRHDSIKIT